MPADEFEALMKGEKVYTSAWESALLACEGLHLISENMKKMDALKRKNENVLKGIECFKEDLKQLQVTDLYLSERKASITNSILGRNNSKNR